MSSGCNLNQTTRNASISKGCKYEILQDNENGSLKYLFVGCSQYKNVGWDVDQAVQVNMEFAEKFGDRRISNSHTKCGTNYTVSVPHKYLQVPTALNKM